MQKDRITIRYAARHGGLPPWYCAGGLMVMAAETSKIPGKRFSAPTVPGSEDDAATRTLLFVTIA